MIIIKIPAILVCSIAVALMVVIFAIVELVDWLMAHIYCWLFIK